MPSFWQSLYVHCPLLHILRCVIFFRCVLCWSTEKFVYYIYTYACVYVCVCMWATNSQTWETSSLISHDAKCIRMKKKWMTVGTSDFGRACAKKPVRNEYMLLYYYLLLHLIYNTLVLSIYVQMWGNKPTVPVRLPPRATTYKNNKNERDRQKKTQAVAPNFNLCELTTFWLPNKRYLYY